MNKTLMQKPKTFLESTTTKNSEIIMTQIFQIDCIRFLSSLLVCSDCYLFCIHMCYLLCFSIMVFWTWKTYICTYVCMYEHWKQILKHITCTLYTFAFNIAQGFNFVNTQFENIVMCNLIMYVYYTFYIENNEEKKSDSKVHNGFGPIMYIKYPLK